MAALLASGCAQVNTLKSKVVGPPANQTPVAPPVAPASTNTADVSLSWIINQQLQVGRYGEGEKSLRQYVKQHPDDRLAQNLLRQLTVDPQQALGSSSHGYTVQSGDSYSTLAARFLGDGSQFLILARYNNSANPSMLRAGQVLRLPASSKAVAAPAAVPDNAVSNASPATQARRLQDESLALLGQGHRDDAVSRYDQALSLDPSLKPSNSDAAGLRTQVLNNYHQRAIVLYRDQKLDQAIALWDHVLAIDPGFEAATVYRTRALELKHRLKQI